VKYAYQELPHSEAQTPHTAKKKRKIEKEGMFNKMMSFKTDTTNN
jgi:hypothetical protein